MKVKKHQIIIFGFIALLSLLPMITLAQTTGDILFNVAAGISPGLRIVEVISSMQNDSSGITGGVAKAILGALFEILSKTALTILNISSSLLDWVLSPDFLRVSMTGPAQAGLAENKLVSETWRVIRDIANIALIFGLVVIAINIILGNQETKAKKALVNFVLIALLINFTPLICGIIIDVSNMLMRYFIQGGVNQGDIVRIISEGSGSSDIGLAIAFFLFSLFASIIYIFYALIFLLRYVMLWILIIFSPLAFATKVFPKSRYITKIFPSMAYWDEWWDQFIQWCVIGIPASLFIYLSNRAMILMVTSSTPVFATPAADGNASIFASLFMYIIPFLFMWTGLMITISSGGPMTQKLAAKAKGVWGATGGAAIGAATGYAAGRAKAAGTYTKEGIAGRIGGWSYNRTKGDDEEKIDWRTREGRDKGREHLKKAKQKVKDTLANKGLASRDWALTKPEAEINAEKTVGKMDLEYYNKNYGDLGGYEVRKAADIKFAKQDVSAYLKGAGDDEAEYQRRLEAIATYDDKSKEWKKIKTKALMDASFKNKHRAGPTDWSKAYGDIDVNEEMQKLSPRDLRDVASKEFLRDDNNLGKLSTGQLNYLMSNGSKAQTDAIEEVGELYRPDRAGKNAARIASEVKAYKLLLKKARKNQAAGIPGADDDVKKYKAELDKRATLVRHFA